MRSIWDTDCAKVRECWSDNCQGKKSPCYERPGWKADWPWLIACVVMGIAIGCMLLKWGWR